MKHYIDLMRVQPKTPDDGPRYGDANDRMMAGAVDLLLLFFLLNRPSQWVINRVYAHYAADLPDGDVSQIQTFSAMLSLIWQMREPWLIANGVIVLMIGLAIIGCQMMYGTTPGKRLLGLKIVDATTLEPAARLQYVARFLGYIASFLPLMGGFLWMHFNKRRRGLHDVIAHTVVIHTRPKGWLWQQLKRGVRGIKHKLSGRQQQPTSSLAAEEPMGQPPATERHENRPDTIP